MSLTKEEVEAALRSGVNARHPVEADELKPGATLDVRSLTQGEASQVNGVALKGQTLQVGADENSGEEVATLQLELDKASIASDTADAMAAAFGLSSDEERWSLDDVKKLPPPLFKRLVAKVKEVTGSEDLLDGARSFRDNAERLVAGERDDGGEDSARTVVRTADTGTG